MKNDEERQGKRRKFEIEKKVPGVSIKKALKFANKEKVTKNQKPKISLEFSFSSR
jgi:hypothetical protein